MFERVSLGFQLVGQSFRVLRSNKQLVVFPLLSGVACMLVLLSFAAPFLLNPDLLPIDHQVNAQGATVAFNMEPLQSPLAYVVLFAFYFANYFVVVFFNSALVACAIMQFKGEKPTLGAGLAAAVSRLPQILAWSAVSATVGMILGAIESRSELVGKIVASLLGAGWAVVTYFAVPLLVIRGASPMEAVRGSLALVRKTWGEALTANFGAGLIFSVVGLVLVVPLMLLVVLGGVGLASGKIVLGILALTTALAVVVLVSLVSTALHTILLAAVFVYAAEGAVPDCFEQESLQRAFRTK